ncbi:metallophosphoesterase [Tropicibacter sp. R16_0]|uniref:metallophosphoesterase family protein n=1 Tax=Tropicibacter sp. R16_0 TaxID=2821102 RepID=UPI001ADA72E8|nr:metallophosphoesterase [Tropicibacter sp. R16_0]MBO9453006.1 metallophosphoesterase [Tropicibacter sp. R16_0]
MTPKFRALFASVILTSLIAGRAAALDVIVISDLNGSYGSTDYSARIGAAIERIVEIEPDLVISTGDMVAGQRTPNLSDKQVREMWKSFHKAVSDPLKSAGIPFAVTPGNHDASAYGGFERERKIYAQEWLPRKPELDFLVSDDYPFFYAFEMQGITFASLDATTLGPLSGNQMGRLQALGANGDPVVTFSHLPLWPFAIQREREIIGDPTLEKVYIDSGVVLHLSGHHHVFYPGWKDGVAYVSQACLGGGARRLIGTADRSPHSFTHITFEPNGEFDIAVYRGPDFERSTDFRSLPKEIRSPSAVLKRFDLVK